MYKYEIEINEINEHVLNLLASHSSSYVDENSLAFQNLNNAILSRLSPYARKAYERDYTLTTEGIKRVRFPEKPVFGTKIERQSPRITSPYLSFDEHFSGLYFLGCVGCNPVTGEYQYCVKVGISSDISKRLKGHASSNPLLFHSHASLPFTDANAGASEGNCHNYLDRIAIGMPAESEEWWFVDKETYMKLCSNFSNPEFFANVAKGII